LPLYSEIGYQAEPIKKLKRKEQAMTTATMPVEVEEVALPSEQIMPAVRGEFYRYTSNFSEDRPLYFLMKCKANKARPTTTEVEQMLQELDLTFIFGDKVFLCSPNSAPSIRLLGNVMEGASLRRLNETEIRLSNVPTEEFYRCLDARSESLLVDTFRVSGASESTVLLFKGMTLSIRTASNKYGLILVKDLTASTCRIEACHILV
jgi:hypothetical protein